MCILCDITYRCLLCKMDTNMCFGTLMLIVGSVLIKAISGSPNLLVSNRRDIRLIDANETSNEFSTRILENLDVVFTSIVDFRFSGDSGVVFWQDSVGKEITSTLLGSNNSSMVWRIKDELATGIAYDWIGRNIYWSAVKQPSVKVANDNGLMEKTLYHNDMEIPSAIALDPHIRFLFWVDRYETNPKIECAAMDGNSSTREIIVHDNIQRPVALALDLRESRIYFSDNRLKFIDSCDYDGSNKRRIRTFGSTSEVMSLTVYHSVIYGIVLTLKINLTDCMWDCYKRGPIFRFDKDNGSNYRELTDLAHPQTIRVMEPDVQSPGVNPCENNNRGCSHLCLLSPHRPYYRCACPTGVKFIDTSNKTCANGLGYTTKEQLGLITSDRVENALLLGRKYEISMVSMDTTDYFREDIWVPGMYKVLVIDYDPQQERFYWLHKAGYVYIKRARLDGSDSEVVIDRQLGINRFTLDINNRYIYYTSVNTQKYIYRVDINGNFKSVIVRRGLRNPYAIAIDAEKGYLYWTDIGYPAKIERFKLDTRERFPLVTTNVRQPDAIYVDKTESKIYWADSRLNRIEVINEDGTGRRAIVNEYLTFNQGLTIFGDKLYFFSYSRELIQVDKTTGEGRRKILDSDENLRAVTTIKLS